MTGGGETRTRSPGVAAYLGNYSLGAAAIVAVGVIAALIVRRPAR
jgi:hypothetical protein